MQISLRRFDYFVRVEWKTVWGESIIVFCSNFDLQIITCFSSFRIYLIYVSIFAILYTLPKYPKFLFYITYMYICHNQYLQCVTVISTSSFINIQISDFSFPVTSSFVCFTMLQNIYREKNPINFAPESSPHIVRVSNITWLLRFFHYVYANDLHLYQLYTDT